MNLLTLPDQDLSALRGQVLHELDRRTRVATEGLDAAAVIYGNESAKRALVVAAAGKHSLLLIGPSNCGKTMIRAVALELSLTETFEFRCCPCGNHPDPRAVCPCTAAQIKRHLRKMPTADMTVEMMRPVQREMGRAGSRLADLRRQIEAASEHRSTALGPVASELLRTAARELPLDPAAQKTVLTVARTIANLEHSETIEASHLAEAVNYRPLRFW